MRLSWLVVLFVVTGTAFYRFALTFPSTIPFLILAALGVIFVVMFLFPPEPEIETKRVFVSPAVMRRNESIDEPLPEPPKRRFARRGGGNGRLYH